MPERPQAVEAADIHPRRVLAVAGLILLTLALVAGACWGLLRLWRMPIGAGPSALSPVQPLAPRLQAAPQDERAAYFAEKERLLHSYGWVDRRAGIARIPIEEAMDLLAGRAGAPAKDGRP